MAASSTPSPASFKVSGNSNLKIVGIVLAITSGCLIGSSFVFKKRGLLRSQAGQTAGEGVAYLKSPLWWIGMTMMILGELCNFAAYAFVEAIIVTPLGALSVVICAILSSIFLKETLTFFGWLGCALCILGSVIIALNAPHEASVGQIQEFRKLFLAPGFLAFGGSLIVASLAIIFYFVPRYGKKSMLWYIAVCSMIGGISVSVTTGLGAAIVTTAMGDNQFKHWFIYFLIGFIVVTLVTEVYYLNVALAMFNTAMVTPTYYVTFTFFSMVTTVVLFQGLQASAAQILTLVMAFLVICLGITILQMSKVDPATLADKLDRRSTILLQAARKQTELVDEKNLTGVEDPGIDSVRGTFGTIGSIIRARSARRLSQSNEARDPNSTMRPRVIRPYDPEGGADPTSPTDGDGNMRGGMKRHQLYDAPMPLTSATSSHSLVSSPSFSSLSTDATRRPTALTFGSQDVVHSYARPGAPGGEQLATHEHRTSKLPPSPAPQSSSALSTPRAGVPPVDSNYPPSSSRTIPLLPPPQSNTQDEGGTVRAKKTQDAPPPSIRTQSAPVTPTHSQLGGSQGERAAMPPTPRTARPDARDVFSSSPVVGQGRKRSDTNDTVESGSNTDGQSEDEHYQSRVESRKKRTYPHSPDDPEESVSLWRRPSLDDSEENAPGGTGIRLVRQAGSGNRF